MMMVLVRAVAWLRSRARVAKPEFLQPKVQTQKYT